MKIISVQNFNTNIQQSNRNIKNCTFCGYDFNTNGFDPSEFEDHGEKNIFDAYDRQRGFEVPTDWRQLVNEANRIGAGCKVEDTRLNAMGINSLRDIGNNCLKGGMVVAADNIEGLKAKGIKNFIILCDTEVGNVAEKCKKSNMPFENFYIPHSDINLKDNLQQFKSRNSISSFVNSILALREGGCFVGCEGGNHRTNRFLSIVRTLDPECKLDLGLLTELDSDLQYARQIYKSLSSEAKAQLGYTPEFELKLLERFARLDRYIR